MDMIDNKSIRHWSLWLGLGALLASSCFLLVWQLILGTDVENVFIFAGFIWLMVRAIYFLECQIERVVNNPVLVFSISWSIVLIFVLCIGYSGHPFNLASLVFLSIFDLLVFLFFGLVKVRKNNFFCLMLGMVFAWCFNLAGFAHHGPWLDLFSTEGLGYIDNFRDAALFNSWQQYSVLSTGVHGLTEVKYNSLYIFLLGSYELIAGSVFQKITLQSNILAPVLVTIGIYRASALMFRIKNFWAPLILTGVFICCFASPDIIANQKSYQLAALFFIPAVPLLIKCWSDDAMGMIELLVLSMLVPLILYSRLYNGFIIFLAFLPLIIRAQGFIRLSLLPQIFLSFFIIFYLVDNNPTVSQGSALNIIGSFVVDNPFLIESYLLLFLALLSSLLLFDEARLSGIRKVWNSRLYRVLLMGLITICSGILLCIVGGGFTYTYFSILPVFWIIFFALPTIIDKGFLQLVCKRTFGLRFSVSGNQNIFKILVFAMAMFSFLSFVVTSLPTIKGDIMIIRKHVKENANRSSNNKALKRQCEALPGNDLFCLIRNHIFATDTLASKDKNPIRALGYNVVKLAANNVGITGVVIPREHFYWDNFASRTKFGIGFMAMFGVPLVYGVHPNSPTVIMGMTEALDLGGEVLAEKDATKSKLCSRAGELRIDNFIIVSSYNSNLRNIVC